MRTVGATAHMRRLLYCDVLDNEVIGVERLELGVRLSVSQQLEQKLGRLLWPASLCARMPQLALSLAANATVEMAKRHDLLLGDDRLQKAHRTLQRHTRYGSCSLMRVFIVNTQIAAACLRRCRQMVVCTKNDYFSHAPCTTC